MDGPYQYEANYMSISSDYSDTLVRKFWAWTDAEARRRSRLMETKDFKLVTLMNVQRRFLTIK